MTKELTKTKELVRQDIVMPAMSGAEALKAWAKYQDLITNICVDEDYQEIQGKRFRKKSGWRKIATFFNLSVEVVEERKEQIGKTLVWHFTCKAIAPTGRFAIGTGSCDAYEKAKLVNGVYLDRYNKPAVPNSIHNIRSTAESRATNRAISNLVGGGEVSADEIVNEQQVDYVDVDADIFDEPAINPAVPPSKTPSCSECSAPITQKVADWSIKQAGRPLCYPCQGVLKAK